MPGKPGKPEEGLFDDGLLLSFLQEALRSMEAAAGEQLSTERAKLGELQQALGGLTAAQQRVGTNDAVVSASQLDRLEQQLAAVEQQVATADGGTKRLLVHSAVVWAGGEAGDPAELLAQPLPPSSAATGATPLAPQLPWGGVASNAGGAVGSSASCSGLLASGLVPGVEAAGAVEAAAEAHEDAGGLPAGAVAGPGPLQD